MFGRTAARRTRFLLVAEGDFVRNPPRDKPFFGIFHGPGLDKGECGAVQRGAAKIVTIFMKKSIASRIHVWESRRVDSYGLLDTDLEIRRTTL